MYHVAILTVLLAYLDVTMSCYGIYGDYNSTLTSEGSGDGIDGHGEGAYGDNGAGDGGHGHDADGHGGGGDGAEGHGYDEGGDGAESHGHDEGVYSESGGGDGAGGHSHGEGDHSQGGDGKGGHGHGAGGHGNGKDGHSGGVANASLQNAKILNSVLGGFEISNETRAEWMKWLERYEKNTAMAAEEENRLNKTNYGKERGPGSGWPKNWDGLGMGSTGAQNEPPPWANVPLNTGLPPDCLHPLAKGECKMKLIRWAYNPYEDKCVKFKYTGCKGNQNNFRTQLKCEEVCMTPLPRGCEMNPQIDIENYNLHGLNRRTETLECDND